MSERAADGARLTFGAILRHIRRHSFAVLATSDEHRVPHAVGVEYGVTRGTAGR